MKRESKYDLLSGQEIRSERTMNPSPPFLGREIIRAEEVTDHTAPFSDVFLTLIDQILHTWKLVDVFSLTFI